MRLGKENPGFIHLIDKVTGREPCISTKEVSQMRGCVTCLLLRYGLTFDEIVVLRGTWIPYRDDLELITDAVS